MGDSGWQDILLARDTGREVSAHQVEADFEARAAYYKAVVGRKESTLLLRVPPSGLRESS